MSYDSVIFMYGKPLYSPDGEGSMFLRSTCIYLHVHTTQKTNTEVFTATITYILIQSFVFFGKCARIKRLEGWPRLYVCLSNRIYFIFTSFIVRLKTYSRFGNIVPIAERTSQNCYFIRAFTSLFKISAVQEALGHDHCPDNGGNVHLWNVGKLQGGNTAVYPRRLSALHSLRENLKSHNRTLVCNNGQGAGTVFSAEFNTSTTLYFKKLLTSYVCRHNKDNMFTFCLPFIIVIYT